jgi:glycosyltransferase involved in cell wall biosynthesis
MIGIHQLLAGFTFGDAISNYARELQRIIRSWGHPSEIFAPAPAIEPKVRHLCRPHTEHAAVGGKGNILIYHFSIGSVASAYYAVAPDARIMIYHNITPDRFFSVLNPEFGALLAAGRREMEELRGATPLALAVSEYNRRELEAAGFSSTGIIPLTLDWSSLDGSPSRSLLLKYRAARDSLIFVGRLVPNKKIEDLLKTFHHYKLIKPAASLFLVGKETGQEAYAEYLRSVIRELELPDVVFTGHISHREWLSYYRLGKVFLCLSEHEGFCLPLLEAMHFGLPVMAYAAAAIPDTLGSAGVLIREKNYPETAEMAAELCDNRELREAVVKKQRERLAAFKSLPVGDILRDHLQPWLF